VGSDAGLSPTGRGRGRPRGTDSAETRARILRAAREVINERGYEAANFQAIASRAGLSRPTMHYYFHTREEIYDCLVAETYSIVVDCIARANREDTLLDQLSAFVTAAYRSGLADGSMIRFTVMARPPGPVVDAVRGFYASIVDDAIARGEIPADTDASAVVSMVLAMFLGIAFYAGFIGDQNDMAMIAKQLYRLIAHGLLDRQRNGHALTMTPVAPVTG
jgi:AcrR family transcriptional regulator